MRIHQGNGDLPVLKDVGHFQEYSFPGNRTKTRAQLTGDKE